MRDKTFDGDYFFFFAKTGSYFLLPHSAKKDKARANAKPNLIDVRIPPVSKQKSLDKCRLRRVCDVADHHSFDLCARRSSATV